MDVFNPSDRNFSGAATVSNDIAVISWSIDPEWNAPFEVALVCPDVGDPEGYMCDDLGVCLDTFEKLSGAALDPKILQLFTTHIALKSI